MKIANWKSLFLPHILTRGWEYYDDELVQIEHVNGYSIVAGVEGTELYSVEITLQNGQVAEMTCDCPYAADGNNCKHMAAVLFAADDMDHNKKSVMDHIISQEKEIQKEKETALIRKIASLSEEQVRSLLLDAAKKHTDIKDCILMKGKQSVGSATKARWKADLRAISRNAADCSGFIDYCHAFDYMVELNTYLKENIAPLLENRMIMDAFDLVGLVFTEAFSNDLDDDGELNCVETECRGFWEELIQSPEADQQKMLEWFKNQIQYFSGDLGEEALWPVVFDCFTDPNLLPAIIDMLDEKIRSAREYALPMLIGKRIILMERMNATKADIESYRMQFWDQPFIRKQELDRLEAEVQWDAALALLRECERMDAENKALLAEYCRRKIRILKLTGEEQTYLETLQHYIFSFPQADITYILELKQSVSKDQWELLLQKLFQDKNTSHLRRELQLNEGMLDQLLSEIEKSFNPYAIKKYEKVLRTAYPERVRDILIRQMDEQMRGASSRSEYAAIIKELKHLYGYPDGREKVKSLAAAWRKDFPRRLAMQDELGKAKL